MYPNKAQKVLLAEVAGSFETQTSDPFTTDGVKNIIVTVKLANEVGTGVKTPKLQRKLKNGDWVDYWTAAAALSAAGTYSYALGEGSTEDLGGLVEELQVPLPKTMRLVLTDGGAGDGNEFDTYAEVEMLP